MALTRKDIPEPIIFGPAHPDVTLVLRAGRQRPESRTNQNLYLQDSDLKDGTYSMGQFLVSRPECGEKHSVRGCPMAMRLEQRYDAASGTDRPHQVFPDPPDYGACPGLQTLKGYCETGAEQLFFRNYCLSANYEWESAYRWEMREMEAAYQSHRLGEEVRPEDIPEDDDLGFDFEIDADIAARSRLPFPALIPQVWLNVIPPANRTLEEELRLEHEPQRVDFLMLAEGRKCIVEIDGPSHYADYDPATGEYSVSEQKYTFNLRVERSLRTHGFEVYRFSRYEVEETPLNKFRSLIKHLPGMPSWW